MKKDWRDTHKKLALFDYPPGRNAVYPQAILHNFKGDLQTDGYAGYDGFDKIEGIITFSCWAQDAAMLYSLLATCRLHNINPEHWLTNLFNQINSTPKENLHQLLPQNYAANFTQQ